MLDDDAKRAFDGQGWTNTGTRPSRKYDLLSLLSATVWIEATKKSGYSHWNMARLERWLLDAQNSWSDDGT